MAVILRDVPPGCNWGWFSREDPRMHLQTVDEEHRNLYKVWLEKKGTRVFEPAGAIPSRILKKLETEVAKRRRHIEGRWAIFMIKHRWLRLDVALPEIAITAYAGTPNKFVRKLDLQQQFSAEAYAAIKPSDIGLNMELGALSVFKNATEDLRHDFDLAPLVWHG